MKRIYLLLLAIIIALSVTNLSAAINEKKSKEQTITLLKGKWKLNQIKSKIKVDLNLDGIKSNDIMSERTDSCLNEEIYEFNEKTLKITTGIISKCEDKIQECTWSIEYNKIYSIFSVFICKKKKFKKRNAEEFAILSVNNKQLKLSGKMKLENGSTTDVLLIYEKQDTQKK